ncbi:MAG: hypothetical protein K9W43_05055 [Candidatus Thorarchaeota archaeon]|nr:hypothetical protein [Candidatus Thorarchaeota archaeon]
MKKRGIFFLIVVALIWTIANIQGAAAYSNTVAKPYDYENHDTGWGCTADADKTTGLTLAHVNCWGSPTNGWGSVGVNTTIGTAHYVTVSSSVEITAYLSTGIFGHAQVDVWIYIYQINNDKSLTELWHHCAWTSGDIGSSHTKAYTSFAPSVSATTGDRISGQICICIRFVAGGAYGATVAHTSSDLTGSARMIVSSITWSY